MTWICCPIKNWEIYRRHPFGYCLTSVADNEQSMCNDRKGYRRSDWRRHRDRRWLRVLRCSTSKAIDPAVCNVSSRRVGEKKADVNVICIYNEFHTTRTKRNKIAYSTGKWTFWSILSRQSRLRKEKRFSWMVRISGNRQRDICLVASLCSLHL